MSTSLPSGALRRGLAIVVAAGAFLAPSVHPAAADFPASPRFGPIIEDYADYEGQKRCKPKPKPGTLALSELIKATYPDTTWIGISRGCDIGGSSEHKEGRALDWARDASDPADRRSVREFLDWLFITDDHGNEDAMVRRLGIMYVIWNRKIWSTWDQGWDVYCVQKKRKCKDPDSKAEVHPHTDHVHISLGWDGAMMDTSFWDPKRSFDGPAPSDEKPAPGVTPTPSPQTSPSPQGSPPPSPD